MFRIDNPTAVPVLPIVPPPGTPGFFYRGNPATATEATIVDDWYMNLVQEELAFVIEQFPSSQVLNKFSTRQLYDAIISIAQWVTNGIVGNYLPLVGGTMQGYITLHAWPTQAMHAVPMSWVQAQGYLTDAPGGAWYVRSAGQWGDLNSFGFATQSWVLSQIPSVSGFLPLTGGTLANPGDLTVRGQLTLEADGGGISSLFLTRGNMYAPNGELIVGGGIIANGLTSRIDTHVGLDLEVERSATIGGDLEVYGSFLNPSDRRLKRDEKPYDRGLEAICALKPISFRYNEKVRAPFDATHYGVAADDIVEVMPEAVGETEIDGENYLTVAPLTVQWALVNAVKQLSERLDQLEAKG